MRSKFLFLFLFNDWDLALAFAVGAVRMGIGCFEGRKSEGGGVGDVGAVCERDRWIGWEER